MALTTVSGRGRQLSLIANALASSSDAGASLLFTGEPGIGKTTLLLAAESFARLQGWRVLSTAGNRQEGKIPYAGMHRIIVAILPHAENLPAIQRAALLTSLGLEEGPHPDTLVLSLAVLNLVIDASGDNGVFIAVDEFGVLDSESRDVIRFLARRIKGHRVTIVATETRPQCQSDDMAVFQCHSLGRLDDSDSFAVVRTNAPFLREAERRWVVDQARGNPLALVELPSLALEHASNQGAPLSGVQLSPLLYRAFGGGLESLEGPERDSVLVSALAAEGNLQEILAATSIIAGANVSTEILSGPAMLGLLSYDANRVEFRHPLVKTAVLQRAPVNRRLAAHRALGDVISTNVRRRVWHRSSGVEGRDDSVAAELEAQGWADIKSFDVVSAAWDFRRAAELSTSDGQRGRRLLIAARQEAQLGMFDESMASSRLAAECELEDIDRGRTELVFPARARGSGEFARLCDHAIRAAEIGDEDLLSDLVFEITRESFRSPATYEIPASLRDTVTTRGGAKRDWRSVAALALSDPVGRGSLVRSEFATLDRNKLSISDGLVTVALGARAVGSYEFCALVAARAISEYRTRRMVLPLLEVLSVSADVQLELGNWEMANSQIAQAFILAGPLQDTHLYAELLVTAAKSAALCGDSERAIQLITQVEQTSFAHSGSAVLCRAEIARGISHLSSGKYLEATSILGRALDTRDRSNHPTERFAGLTYLAEAAVRSGDRRRIDEVVDELEQLACASELLETQLQYARSVLSGDSTAETVFVESLASEFSGSTWARARIQLAYGRWLRRNRQVSRSRGPLSAALETFESMGAVRWAREARDELSATGRRSSEDRRSDPAVASLSVQELKVARLAGEGLSNTEIGHQLSISARTVGAHLYRVYPKLDITSRRELAVRLSESVEIGELAGD